MDMFSPQHLLSLNVNTFVLLYLVSPPQHSQLQLCSKPRQALDHALHWPHEAHSHGVHQRAAEETTADASVCGRQCGEGR